MIKIFVATDFSDVSNNAVDYACGLATELNGTLTIVHVYESPLFYTTEMPYTAIEAAEELSRGDAEKKMNGLRQRLSVSNKNLQVEYITKRGISVEAILEAADQNGASMVVAGATGAGVIERTLIGTTTSSLINKSICPVLIIPGNARYKNITSIVYTTDLNSDNIRAVKSVLPFATALNAEMVFLFVDSEIHTDSEVISTEMAEKIRLNVQYPKTSGYVCTDADVMHGISNFIHKNKTDMVVMLTHKRTFPNMLWDKSLTKKFSYHPDVPLMVIHAE